MIIYRFIGHFPTMSEILPGIGPAEGYLGPNVYCLSREQAKLGDEVHIVCKGVGQYENIDGIHVHRVGPPYNISALLKVKKLSRQSGLDILHVHATSCYFLALFKRLVTSHPLVAHVHGTTISSQNASEGLGLQPKVTHIIDLASVREKLLWRRAQRVIAVSRAKASELVEHYGLDSRKISVVHNGVDTALFKPSRNRDEIRERLGWKDRRVVLYVGRLSPIKGVDYLVRAAHDISRRFRNVLFAFIGGVPSFQGRATHSYVEDLNRLVQDTSLERFVSFLGSIPHTSLPDFYSAADIFVLPSLCEALPKVLMEAMACEKPCIATRVGGVPEVVREGVDGLLVPPADSNELSRALQALLSDDGLVRRMGEAARDRVLENFTWQAAARRLRSIYEELSN